MGTKNLIKAIIQDKGESAMNSAFDDANEVAAKAEKDKKKE